MEIKTPDCKKFSGYKPCYPYKNCYEDGCADLSDENRIGKKILIISLDALGNVLDNTPILYSLKRKYPVSTIFWITMPRAKDILFNNHLIDKIYVWTDIDRMILRNIKFDLLLNADKSDYACAFANEISAERKLGFLLNQDGKIIPANESALYSYRLGLNDKLKFRENTKTGVEIIHEVFELEYKRDPYIFNFTNEEKYFIESYKAEINYNPDIIYVGINTGCSELFPNKKMTIEQHIELIKLLLQKEKYIILLLGGKEDTERNDIIYNAFNDYEKKRIINTPTNLGIRKGACFMDISDIVISGDSFGMHLAIALRKYVIAWFGLSCWAEVELYDNGVKIIPEGLDCAPCWKRECPYNLECVKMINLNEIVKYVFAFKKQIASRS
ncbi:MAG: lipopolysaccharide heptosyltransferase family protein [Ignavibacteria bacterium]|nr:lipopolysaccharide heptosyltransferase family protein [Ignavibacteria bacterium]